MFRRHRTTIAYAALAGLIALTAAAIWVYATGRLQLPPGIVVAFALGSGLAANTVEKTARRLRARRRPGVRRAHARTTPTTKTPSGGAA